MPHKQSRRLTPRSQKRAISGWKLSITSVEFKVSFLANPANMSYRSAPSQETVSQLPYVVSSKITTS